LADVPFDLAAQQLVELLELVSSFSDETSAQHGAVERAAQVLEAEVAAVILGGQVVHSVGFPAGAPPHEELVEVTLGRRTTLDVPRLGRCAAAAADLDGPGRGHLVLARLGEDFSPAEWNLLRGMARILDLSLHMLRTMDSLRQRQRLMEHLYRIQRSISRRMPLPEVLDTVVHGVQELLGDDLVGLWLPDPHEPGSLLLVASAAPDSAPPARLWRIPVAGAGAAGQAVATDELSTVSGYAHGGAGLRELTRDWLAWTMAAPVRESTKVVGSLFTASRQPGRVFTEIDREILLAFAENVSLALTDAKTVSDMNEAFHDSLTGLASRPLFLDRLQGGLAAEPDVDCRVALLFIDLDRFKSVNDTLGHAAGDALLVIAAKRIQACLRAEDVAARFGGDEFAVMLRDVTLAQAQVVAGRIIEAIERPYPIGGDEVRVGASIGVALCGSVRHDAGNLLHRADAAMYRAKRNGRGRFETYEPGMELRPALRPVDADLRQAIDDFVQRAVNGT
jgi:diguanylate cyclase (GGDEF)-like protein